MLQGIFSKTIVSAVTDAQEKRAKQNPVQAQVLQGSLQSGRGKEDGYRRARRLEPGPNAAKRTKEFIEKGGNADPVGDAIQDGDYHDLLDQNGGPEGF